MHMNTRKAYWVLVLIQAICLTCTYFGCTKKVTEESAGNEATDSSIPVTDASGTNSGNTDSDYSNDPFMFPDFFTGSDSLRRIWSVAENFDYAFISQRDGKRQSICAER